MLTILPCGGLGELDPRETTGMRIICRAHRIWERDRAGLLVAELVGGESRYRFRDTAGCGAITEAPDGVRVVVGYLEHEVGRAAA